MGDVVGRKNSGFSVEFRESVVREVIDHSRPIVDVAAENNVSTQSVSRWVTQFRADHLEMEDELTDSEQVELKRLKRENDRLRTENEFLGKAAAFFAKKHP